MNLTLVAAILMLTSSAGMSVTGLVTKDLNTFHWIMSWSNAIAGILFIINYFQIKKHPEKYE